MSTLLGDNTLVITRHVIFFSSPHQTLPLKPSVIELLTERSVTINTGYFNYSGMAVIAWSPPLRLQMCFAYFTWMFDLHRSDWRWCTFGVWSLVSHSRGKTSRIHSQCYAGTWFCVILKHDLASNLHQVKTLGCHGVRMVFTVKKES